MSVPLTRVLGGLKLQFVGRGGGDLHPALEDLEQALRRVILLHVMGAQVGGGEQLLHHAGGTCYLEEE